MKKPISSSPRASHHPRKIAIVGAGQAGLQLGMSLLERGGYDVTLLSDRSSDEVANGRLQATAIMYQSKRQFDQALGLNFWDQSGQATTGFEIDVREAGGRHQLSFGTSFCDGDGLALDFRLKYPAWMREFELRGGNLIIHQASLGDLEDLHENNDLVVLAAGKGHISRIFERDPDRSPPYSAPMRQIAVAAVDKPWLEDSSRITLIPGLGEIVFLPLLTPGNKRSTGLLLFGHPGSPILENFSAIQSGPDLRQIIRDQVRIYCPEFSDFMETARLTDDAAYLHGGLTPMVKKPVGRLPSGASVLGIADCVAVVDPLCGNGLNNAAVMADLVSQRIADHGQERFDEKWMNSVFDEFWRYGKDVFLFMRSLLEQPQHLVNAIGSVPQNPRIGDDIINGYPDPHGFASWMKNASTAQNHVASRLLAAA